MNHTWLIPSSTAMLQFGQQLTMVCPPRFICYLHGTLGAGKTTLVRGFLQGLGHQGRVKSPTYTLVEPYTLPQRQVFHFDLYRLADPEELDYIGIRDYLRTDAICLFEWAEKGEGWLPPPDWQVQIDYVKEEQRHVSVKAETPIGEQALVGLQAANSTIAIK